MNDIMHAAHKVYREMLDNSFTKADQKKIKKQQKDIAHLFDNYIKEIFQGAHRQSIKYILRDVKKRKGVELEDLLHEVYADAFAQLRDVIIEAVERKLIQETFMLGFAIGGLAERGLGIPEAKHFGEGGQA